MKNKNEKLENFENYFIVPNQILGIFDILKL